MTIPPRRLSQAQRSWVNTQLKTSLHEGLETIDLILGDGSTRQFYRAKTSQHSAILIVDPQWIQSKDYFAHQIFLKQTGVSVPDFFAENPAEGLLLMEDLGDTLVQSHISSYPNEKMALLHSACKILAEIHGRTYPVPPSLPAASRFFDERKYFEELEFTETHLITGLLRQSKWSNSERKEIKNFAASLAQIQPLVFCHRDYHTRNMCLIQGRIVLIDFQDARMGSPHYDLASLLYDPYVSLQPADRDELKRTYRESLSAHPVAHSVSWDLFDRDLMRLAVQRLAKAAGSFASFYTRSGKTTHLMYVKPALETIALLSDKIQIPPGLTATKWLAALESAKLTK